MRFYWGVLALAVVVVGGVTWGALAVNAHERDLDQRCEAAGGRRVDIGVGEKLCFTEDWRWVRI